MKPNEEEILNRLFKKDKVKINTLLSAISTAEMPAPPSSTSYMDQGKWMMDRMDKV
jgi:hypothetical protein